MIIGLLQLKSERLNREYALRACEFTRMDSVTTVDHPFHGPKALDGPGLHLKHLHSRPFAACAVDLFKRSHTNNQVRLSW